MNVLSDCLEAEVVLAPSYVEQAKNLLVPPDKQIVEIREITQGQSTPRLKAGACESKPGLTSPSRKSRLRSRESSRTHFKMREPVLNTVTSTLNRPRDKASVRKVC